MGRKSVAVLDIRSSEVAIVIGERGVNNTFMIKASKTEAYDGYDENTFYDTGDLANAIHRALNAVEEMCGERVKELYVGVPGAFCEVEPKEKTISFPKKRKIGHKETEALYASGREKKEGYRYIHASSMIYITADDRRVVDPTGITSSVLSGVLSYFYCSEYFATTLEDIFHKMRIALHFMPTQFLTATYLIPSETRDEYALFLDVGFLSSTILVMLGNGVLAQQTYWVGRGQIAAGLMQKFNLPYDAALSLLSKVNLYTKSDVGNIEYIHQDVAYEINVDELNELVKEGLDEICEAIGKFLDDCSGKELDYKPLYVSGEGIYDIRGALDHVSKRVSRVCEQLAPDLPYYNKPPLSSRIALMDAACDDHRQSGILNRFLNGFGG